MIRRGVIFRRADGRPRRQVEDAATFDRLEAVEVGVVYEVKDMIDTGSGGWVPANTPPRPETPRLVKIHRLKCLPEQFEAIRSGVKRCEIRNNDRLFDVGDLIEECEFDPTAVSSSTVIPRTGLYTGNVVTVKVTHITHGFGLREGTVALSIALWSPENGRVAP